MGSTPQRAYYRIRYPLGARPELEVEEDGGRAEVLDVAEYGMSFVIRELGRLEVGQRVRGTLRIEDRWSVRVDGDVVWITGDMAAVRFRDPIPFKIILDEQLYLRSHYPLRY